MAKKIGGTAVGGTHDYSIPLQTVGVLLKKYRDRDPDKTALVDLDQDKSITFGQLHEEANRIARCLADMGIGKGDRVAVLSDERLEKLLIWMGIWRLGATIMPLNVEMNIAYIPEILSNLGPKLVLWHEDMDVGRMTEGVDCDTVKFTSWEKGMDGDAGSEEFFARAASFVYVWGRPPNQEQRPCTAGSTRCSPNGIGRPRREPRLRSYRTARSSTGASRPEPMRRPPARWSRRTPRTSPS